MLTITLVLFGTMVLSLVLAERAVRRWPLTPAVIYLMVGLAAGGLLGAPPTSTLVAQAAPLALITELAVLGSLFAVGLRLRLPTRWRAWRVALLLAGPGVVVAIAAGTLAALGLLQWSWPAALLVAAVLAPTDPVLASEVQIRSEEDRDAVRLSLTAEGGLNDGSALPAVMLALALLAGTWDGWRWAAVDLAWPIGAGAALGLALGQLLGHALRWQALRGNPIARDELLYVGAVALAWGLARATGTSSFVVVFLAGATLLEPVRRLTSHAAEAGPDDAVWARMHRFGARIERLVEAGTVLAVGVALHSVEIDGRTWLFAAVLVGAVRPLSVLAVVRRGAVARSQRRLLAWFGIRGVGSLYYLAFAIEHGIDLSLAEPLTRVVLVSVALSIVLHGVSATPLMTRYQRRRRRPMPVPPDPTPPP